MCKIVGFQVLKINYSVKLITLDVIQCNLLVPPPICDYHILSMNNLNKKKTV